MITKFSKQIFDGKRIEASLKGPIECEDCVFQSGALGMFRTSVEARHVISGVSLIRCKALSCHVGPVVIQDCVVDRLQINPMMFCWGTCFVRVTLRGKIGRFVLQPMATHEEWEHASNVSFWQDNLARYASAGWALDISEAEFSEFDCRSVPGELIRTDTSRQSIVRYEATKRALKTGKLKHLSADFIGDIETLLYVRQESKLDFVLCKSKKEKDAYVNEGIEGLRKMGLLLR